MRVYLDNAATTKTDDIVSELMRVYENEYFGNASSIHCYARDARRGIENAREIIADFINCSPREILFTSGATEGNNWALRGFALKNRNKGKHIITTQIEHHAVLDTCKYLESIGFEVTYLPVSEEGVVSIKELKNAIREDTIMVSIMSANNEIGTIQPIKEIGEILSKKGICFHTDAVQAIGKMEIDVKTMNIDMLSMSAHKLHGPKGIGFLYVRKGIKIDNLMYGGEQERGLRPGTYNTPAIVGLGKCIELTKANLDKNIIKMTKLRDYFIERLLNEIKDSHLNGSGKFRICNNINISFKGVDGEALLYALDMAGIACSAGSACTANIGTASHVIEALNKNDAYEIGSQVRFSLSKYTTQEEIDYTVNEIKEIVGKLRKVNKIK